MPQRIGDSVGENNICNEWKNHFSRVYNSVSNSSDDFYHNCSISSNSFNNDLLFTDAELLLTLCTLDSNKSCGNDNIFAEHLKFSSLSTIVFLCKMLNSFLLHGSLVFT